VVGSYLPFARTKSAREASGDPRLSIEERYADRAAYLGRIAEAALALQRDRMLLPEDVPVVLERAAAHWDWRAGRP
jgi:alpha/beta hydrolase family protein